MWYAIFNASTGALVSLGTVVADQLPADLSVTLVGQDRPNGNWNPVALRFDSAESPEIVWAPQEFMARFTVVEETAIRARAMTDASMQTFLARVERARSVSNKHPDTLTGIEYCISLGLITDVRGQEILHG